MIHRTFRSLDQAPKLVGFTVGHWAALIADTGLVLGVVYALGLPAKASITLLVFAVGLPAALAYVSETGGIQLGTLLADLLRWRVSPRALDAVPPPTGMGGARGRSVKALLGVAGIEPDGLLIRDDGAHVRYLEVSPVHPLVLEPAAVERASSAFAQLAARLPDGESLQLCVEACPLGLDELLALETHRCEQAAGAAHDVGEEERAKAIRALGIAHERSIRQAAQTVYPLRLRYLVVCPWRPRRARGRRRVARDDRAIQDSLRHAEGVRAELNACGLEARTLSGLEVLDVLAARFDPGRRENGGLPASFLTPGVVRDHVRDPAPGEAERQGRDLASAICTAPLELGERDHLQVGGRLERCFYVSLAPEQTWLGWLLHLMQAPRPFTLSVHVQATERYRERMAQKRRYRRIHGVNRGVEGRGRPLDPDARLQEQEAAELNDELAASAGAGIYRVSVYGAISEPAGDREALRELCQSAGREAAMACDARVQHGPFAQAALWRSTVPLGRDVAGRRRKYVSANVGDTFPLIGTSCGSPDGIPLGFALPGRTLEQLNPFDAQHPNHLLLINGMSGAGKTMAAIILLARAISQGAGGFIIDRAGHFDFLASLIPGAASVQVGGDAHAINCWDVQDPARVGPEKVDYLLALHALLLGEHHASRDSYGLTDLEANILGLAIGEVYARCALTGEEPRELLLQDELERRYQQERAEGSLGIAEALRNLSMRVNNYVLDGPYAYLTDRPTTIPSRSPLVVFDTRSVADAKAAATLFVICEHVKSRIERERRSHLAGEGPAHGWSGRSFLVIDEAWKLIERPATGRWFNEFCRRSRHYALWLVAISQQLSDFDNEHGRALLANAAMRLFLRQEARELTYVKQTLALSDEAIDAISNLRTVRGAYSTAYLMNGTRGQGTIQIGVGPWEYWIASSDPARDEPLRRRALRETAGDGWAALKLLVREEWHDAVAAEHEETAG